MSLPVAPSPEQLLQKVVDIVLDFFKEQLVTLKEGEVVSYASNIDFLLSKASNKDDIVGPYNGQEIIYTGRLVNQDEYEIICEVKNSSDLVLKPNEDNETQNTQIENENENENETGSVKIPLFKLNELDNLIIELNKYSDCACGYLYFNAKNKQCVAQVPFAIKITCLKFNISFNFLLEFSINSP